MTKHPLGWRSALILVSALGLCLGLHANAEEAGPHALAETVKDQLVSVIDTKAEIEADGGADKYYEAIRAVFQPLIDYELVASFVMGDFHAQATEAQRQTFAQKLESGLMRSVTVYTQALAASGDYQFEVLPPAEPVGDKDRVVVGLEARSGETVNHLSFYLFRTPEDEWKLINLVLEKANMGNLLRVQFATAMARNQNNIEQVIANWGK